MAFTPRSVEVPFDYEGDTYTLVFDWETIAVFEEATGLSIFALADPKSGPPKMSDMGQMLLAALRENHPDLTRAHAMQMLTDPTVQKLFQDGLASAMPQVGDDTDEGAGAAVQNPMKRGPARKPKRSAGKKR